MDDISLSKADEVLLTFFESETRYTTMSSIPLSIRIFNGMLIGQEMPSLVFTSDTEEESDIFLTSHPNTFPIWHPTTKRIRYCCTTLLNTQRQPSRRHFEQVCFYSLLLSK